MIIRDYHLSSRPGDAHHCRSPNHPSTLLTIPYHQAMKLIQEGVYFNSPDSSRDDALPIHTACKAGNRAMLDTMIEMGKQKFTSS